MDISETRIREIQSFLDRPENRERARRLRELDTEIENQRETMLEAEKRCAVLSSQIPEAENKLREVGDALEKAEHDENDSKAYFLEDLKLGFFPEYEGTPELLAQKARDAVRAEDRGRAHAQMMEALQKNYQQHNNTLLVYQPNLELIFEAAAKPEMLRQRYCLTLQSDGKRFSLYDFIKELQSEIDAASMLLEEKDRELFENILTKTISIKLRERVEESRQWTTDMTALMCTLKTSMGLTFRLDWKPKRGTGEEELDTVQLVQLLNKDRELITPEDSSRLSGHFRAKVRKAREEAGNADIPVSYADLIRGVLDYRDWYEFVFLYEREGEPRRELTDRAFNKFSGGEKAMAMYVPLFAAVSAQYQKSGPQCPRLLALDEAFAGVDERNISAMFELVETLEFDYIMNSQALWGCYPCVKSLDIAELHRPANAQVVTILRYYWNGARQRAEE